jgi:hypothetical protein
MSGPKRNPDKLNTIGVIVVGICGAVLVYVTIVALEAFYVNDTSEIQTMADYGGQDTNARSLRAEQTNRIGEYGTNPRPAAAKPSEAAKPQTYRVPIDVAMKLIVDGARTDPGGLIPSQGRSDRSTVLPIFGRPKLTPPPAAAPAPAGGAAPATPAGAAPGAATPGAAAPGAASGSAAGSAAAELPAAPQVPTGAGTGPSPVGGAGPLDKPSTPGTPRNPTVAPPGAAPKAGPAAGAAPKAGSAAAAPLTDHNRSSGGKGPPASLVGGNPVGTKGNGK